MSDKQWDAAWAALVLAFLMLLYGITGEGDYQDEIKTQAALDEALVAAKRWEL